MRLEAGVTVVLEVAREVSPFGYFLTNGEQDVLLHYSETDQTTEGADSPIQPGDQVSVFLYHDSEDRLAATMKTPAVQYGEVGLLEVADFNSRLGCFLDMGLSKQLLLPMREMSELEMLRPQVGDRVYIRLDRDKQGRLLARMAREEDFEPLVVHAPADWNHRSVEAIVYKTLQIGSFVICQAGVLGFGVIGMVHASERIGALRVGQLIKVRVTHVREDGRVNLSMRKAKEVGRIEDADKLLAYLQARPNGAMPYSDETPADVIQDKFQMSKSAFKRALGKLMKEGKVEQKVSWTYLKDAEPSAKSKQ